MGHTNTPLHAYQSVAKKGLHPCALPVLLSHWVGSQGGRRRGGRGEGGGGARRAYSVTKVVVIVHILSVGAQRAFPGSVVRWLSSAQWAVGKFGAGCAANGTALWPRARAFKGCVSTL